MNSRHHDRRWRQPPPRIIQALPAPNTFNPWSKGKLWHILSMSIHRPTDTHSQNNGKTIKWVLSIFLCFLCSALPRFLFRLTIECTREYKKLDTIWSKSGCDKNNYWMNGNENKWKTQDKVPELMYIYANLIRWIAL